MAKPNRQVNRKQTNERAIEQAVKKFRDRLTFELSAQPEFFGSVQMTVQVTGGIIDRFRVTNDETTKCDAITST